MNYWEFLIQQEGELAWLSLKSGKTEILAGRYRVIARCDRPHTPADISVTYEPLDLAANSPLIRKRIKQTNEDGLMVVLPYTDFTPGLWSLGCSGRAGSGETPADWHYAAQIQVLSPVESKPELEPVPQPPEEAPQPPAYQLQLDREVYALNSQNRTLTLAGKIESTSAEAFQALHLRIRLRDPQTANTIVLTQRLLGKQTPPHPFRYEIALPANCTTRLLLGEILLCNAVPTTLASQSFTVMVNLDGLLGSIDTLAQQAATELADERAELPAELDAPKFAAVRTWRVNPPLSLSPEAQQALPPLLNTSGATGGKKSLDLPFADELAPPNQTVLAPATNPAVEPLLSILEGVMPADAPADPPADPPADTPENALPSLPIASDPEVFQELPLSDRFGSRLQEMAKDEELSQWLTGNEPKNNPFQLSANASLKPAANDWEAAEIVLDDEPTPVQTRSPATKTPPNESHETLPVLSADEAVPMPVLIVPNLKLTAGQSVTIRVRLPEIPIRLCVKLWLHDRQNHQLLDSPRWLTDFLPTGTGEQETMVQLTVPYGGLEVQFEAIAVEMLTQRESGKTTVERQVVPPGPPVLPLEAIGKSSG
jgi:hypothetical protein